MTEVLTEPVVGPQAWTAEDLQADEPYIRSLSADEAASIDEVLAATGDLPAGPQALAALADELLDVLDNGIGYAVVRGLPIPDTMTTDAASRAHQAIAQQLGDLVPQDRAGSLVRHLADPRHPAQPGGSYHSKAGAPFHTDPTDIVSYLCLSPARSGGARVIASAATVFNALLREHPEWVDLVHEEFTTDWEHDQPTDAPGWFRRPIFSSVERVLSCSLSPKRIVSAMRFHDVPRLSADQMSCLLYLESLLRRSGTAVHVELQAGDVELVNNYTVIHSRTGFVDDLEDPAFQRCLQRLWISRNPPSRPLVPALERLRAGIR